MYPADARVQQWPLWIAQYYFIKPDPQKKNPSMPRIRSDWTFWQYSPGEKNSEGARYGIGRRGVDVNVFNGTFDELLLWAGVSDISIPVPLPLTLEERVSALEVQAHVHAGV